MAARRSMCHRSTACRRLRTRAMPASSGAAARLSAQQRGSRSSGPRRPRAHRRGRVAGRGAKRGRAPAAPRRVRHESGRSPIPRRSKPRGSRRASSACSPPPIPAAHTQPASARTRGRAPTPRSSRHSRHVTTSFGSIVLRSIAASDCPTMPDFKRRRPGRRRQRGPESEGDPTMPDRAFRHFRST